jgi:hypothetical protein
MPLYDQKYYPMDDVLKPSRAAQHRAKYEAEYPDEDSEGTDYHEDEQSDSDQDGPHQQPYPNKRRKLSVATPQGTRRSSRQINRDVLCDTSVHPQDEEIECMEVDTEEDGTSSEDEENHSQTPQSDTITVVAGGRSLDYVIGKYTYYLTGLASTFTRSNL